MKQTRMNRKVWQKEKIQKRNTSDFLFLVLKCSLMKLTRIMYFRLHRVSCLNNAKKMVFNFINGTDGFKINSNLFIKKRIRTQPLLNNLI